MEKTKADAKRNKQAYIQRVKEYPEEKRLALVKEQSSKKRAWRDMHKEHCQENDAERQQKYRDGLKVKKLKLEEEQRA